MAAVRMVGLGRTYARRRQPPIVALDELTLDVAVGEVHGLLGPNGAGKSTLIKILTTLLLPTAGSAHVCGHDVVAEAHRVRTLVGVTFGGERGLYPRVSARRNLSFWGAVYQMDARSVRDRSQALLERVGLADRADEPVEGFSRGMKQRLHLARGLLHDPQVIFLDEPTAGMDPFAAVHFRQLVRELRGEGRSVFLATHDLPEASALCDRVSLIDHGRLVLSGPTDEIGGFLGNRECVAFDPAGPDIVEALAGLPGVLRVAAQDRGQHRAYLADQEATATVLRWLIDRGVLSARREQPSLEEVYMHAVGDRGLRL
jgi:ABC-2 type transport system ATP-binding protein